MKVINLFAGPGAGKSTLAAGVFSAIKMQGVLVELVTEYAKELVWDNAQDILQDSILVFAEQRHRILRLEGKVDYVITDSPLLLSRIYRPETTSEGFKGLVFAEHNRWSSRNFIVARDKPYVPAGRNETVEQAVALDVQISFMLMDLRIPYHIVTSPPQGILKVVETIGER